jgi:hypothetical protein
VQDALQELETEKLALAGGTVTGQILIGNTGSLVFEGSTIDAYETTITVADPTSSDKTITFPDTTGTVITTGDTGTVTGTMLANGTIQNVDIKSDAAIAYSKLASVASGYILVGNGASTSVAAAVAVTGDISINNAGLTSIAAGVIVDADISGSAAITGSKIATGTTSAVGVLQLTDSATSTSATTAATPAAVKIAKDAADAAATTANAALATTGGVLTGHLTLDDEKELRFREEDAGGDHYIALKAAAALAADVTLTLPAVAPTAGQVLKANASTPTTLEWGTDSATDATKMPLAGGTFTGDVTFTGDSSNGLWDKSASAFVADLTGTASIATSITVADESTDTTCNVLFATGATGNLAPKSGTNLTFNSSSGALTATSFVGALTGNVTGNASGSAATVTGAAQSAITSVGTLTGLTVDGDVTLTGANYNVVWDKSQDRLEFADSAKAIFGAGSDFSLHHDGTNSVISNQTGTLYYLADTQQFMDWAGGETQAKFVKDGAVELYHDNTKRLETSATGVTIPNTLTVSDGANFDGDVKFEDNGGTTNAMFWDKSESSLRFNDNIKIELGNSDDLQISHDGSTNIIDGRFHPIELRHQSKVHIKCVDDGQVELYNNDVKTFETVNNGVKVLGDEGADALLYLSADEGDDNADQWVIKADASSGNFAISNYSTGSWVNGLTLNGSNNATFAGTVSDSIGNVRRLGTNAQSSTYTLTASDSGKVIYDGGDIQIPAGTFVAGDMVTIINNSGSDVAINKVSGASVDIYLAGNATPGNRTLATRGVATIVWQSSGQCYISGAGLS